MLGLNENKCQKQSQLTKQLLYEEREYFEVFVSRFTINRLLLKRKSGESNSTVLQVFLFYSEVEYFPAQYRLIYFLIIFFLVVTNNR